MVLGGSDGGWNKSICTSDEEGKCGNISSCEILHREWVMGSSKVSQ